MVGEVKYKIHVGKMPEGTFKRVPGHNEWVGGKRGKSKYSLEFNCFRAMWDRCSYKSHKAYKSYGGRGIGVCDRWTHFLTFFADMGPRPSKNHSIDRIDSKGHYTPENCRWATSREQSLNTSKKSNVGIIGISKTKHKSTKSGYNFGVLISLAGKSTYRSRTTLRAAIECMDQLLAEFKDQLPPDHKYGTVIDQELVDRQLRRENKTKKAA